MVRIRSTHLTFFLLLSGFVALAIGAWAGYQRTGHLVGLETERELAVRTQQLLERSGTLASELSNGERGYLITGRDDFLAHHRLVRRELEGTRSELSQLYSAADGRSLSETQALDELVTQRLQFFDRLWERRKQRGPALATDLQVYEEGHRIADALSEELQRLQGVQVGVIDRWASQIAQARESSLRIGLVLAVLSSGFAVIALTVLVIEHSRREQAQRHLRRANARLEAQVAKHTSELRLALKRIQSFAAELDRGIEAERRRLAREVHDQFGQIVTAMKMRLSSLRDATPNVDDERVNELTQLADDAIAVARRIAFALRPPLLDDLGFSAAVDHLLQDVQREGTLNTQMHIVDDEMLNPEQANQLFRITQEAVTNVIRHARAQRLTVQASQQGGSYHLKVIDDGVGPGTVRATAQGLRNMAERANLVGGVMLFGAAASGQGSALSVVMPLSPTETLDGKGGGDDNEGSFWE